MSNVELSIQLQTDSIAAVKSALIGAIAPRPDDTLWWLTDNSHDIEYQNRISGAELVILDQNINNITIGQAMFASWFAMQNSYFSTDQPILGVSTLKQAIETYYRWRVAGYFNDVMKEGNSENISPQYVFPNPGFSLGIYTASGTTTGTMTTPTSGPVDITKIGPGILTVTPTHTIGGANLVLSLTAVYQDGTTVAMPVTVNSGSGATDVVVVGGQALTAPHTGSSGNGVVHVTSTTKFKAGQWVLVREDLTGTTDFDWKTEVAEVVSVDSGTQVTLRQPTPTGSTTPFAAGLRNNFTTSAFLYPLFINVTGGTSQTNGTSGDAVAVGFDPDRPQGFLDISGISYPQ